MDAIAVVGLGCVLPNAHRVSDFWSSISTGRISLTKVPPRAWDHSLYFSPDRTMPDRAHADVGGFISDFVFDWRKYKVTPADAQQVNPMQWMVLEAGTQALSEVRVLPRETTGILLGATTLGWQRDSGMHIRLEDMLDAVRTTDEFRALPLTRQQEVLEVTAQRLRARLKECSDDNVVGSSASVAVGRINMQFDLKGLHYSVDAGYSSALAALDLAVRGLRDGEFDLAVAGGVSEMLTPLEFIAFSKLGGLSHKGHVRPFSDDSDGTLLGEGVSLFALKRLEDAERDGETIYAVLRGIGGSSDGRGKSLVAPRREGQALAMRRAIDDAGVDPASVQYVECHATGTQVGDASEIQALASIYAGAPGSIALGSVKANIGHLRAGAGAVGLLKAVLSLHHGQIPPQPGVERVNPRLELERTPFFVPRKAQPFRPGSTPLASVSSFSFGGNNYHTVLEAYRPGHGRTPLPRKHKTEPLAIIGMGGMFPGAPTVEALWQRLLEGHDATREVPAERWKSERYSHPDRKDRTYTKLGCWLENLPSPTLEMRIPPAAWASLDPSHVVTLLSAEQALKDAGYSSEKWDRSRVSLALGFLPYQGIKFLADTRVRWTEFARELRETMEKSGLPEWMRTVILRGAEERYKAGLPPISEDSLTGYLGSLNAGRISSLYDFHGPHMVMDSACASSLAALHAASKLLNHREADVVLTGGVWADMSPEFFIAGCRFNALSARGSSPFSANADGFVPGEGAGILVLKRLSDAERDGDRIHSVIRAIAGSSDGKGRSVLPPSEMGETLAMRRALAAANVPPTSVDYVECHGTGTALGDVVETKSTHNAYGEGRTRPLLIGSVKSNIGHLNAAAGAAGMIKVTRAMQEHLLPRSLKSEPRNPKIPQGLEVVSEQREWPPPVGGGPRRAGVSSFGVGGSNFHAILEEYKAPEPKPTVKEPEPMKKEAEPPADAEPRLIAVAGADVRACLEQVDRLCEGTGPLEDTRQVAGGGWRVALTARTREELRKKRDFLRKAVETGGDMDFLGQSGIFAAGPDAPLRGAPVAITFPGQGGQYANMLRPLARAYPVVQATLDEADRVYLHLTGRTLTSGFYAEDAKAYRQNDEDIHAAVFLVNVALYRLLRCHGIRADVLVGQSAGELAALVAAGTLTLEEGLRAIHSRTLAVLEMPTVDPGQMAALNCASEQVPELLAGIPGYATLAADNGPRACIVSADREALPVLVERCAARGIECTVLAVSHGYHSALIAGARPAYQRVLEGFTFRKPEVKLVSSIDAAEYGERPARDYPAFLTSQFVEPVRLRQALAEAHRQGARIFIEAGPKWSLTQFTREILKGQPHGAIASIHPKVGDMEQFKRVVGYSFVNGVGQLSADAMRGEADVEQVLLGLPLDSVLEPATALKVAIALGREFGVDASVARPENLRTLEGIIALVEQLRTGQSAAPRETAVAAPVAAPAAAASAAPTAQPVTTVQKSIALESEVRRMLLDTVVAKTGYPEDMLEMDLDLEADLGIDTVKQVDIFARTREAFGVSRDPNRALRDFNTLRKVIDHIVERVQQAAPPAPAAPASIKAAPAMAPVVAASTATAAIATAIAAAPVAQGEASGKRPGGGGPRSVRDALLSMNLRQAGLVPEELRRLGDALSARTGLAAPDVSQVNTLGELVQHMVKDH